MSRALRARSLRLGDGIHIASMMQDITPLHVDVLRNLKDRINWLIASECLLGAVVEAADGPHRPARVVGTTMLAFVTDEFYRRHFDTPVPFLTSLLLQKVDATSNGHILGRKEQAEGNLGNGLHQVIIEFAIEPMNPSDPAFAPIMNELFSAYFKFERGYNIKSVFVEADSGFEGLVTGSGLLPFTYLDIAGSNEHVIVPPGISKRRGLFRSTREDKTRLSPSSAAYVVMTYIPPAFRFTPNEQRLLTFAIEGHTDDQIARTLDVSRDAIKQTWRGIYDHVVEVMPQIFMTQDDQDIAAGRGTEKRRHVVTYVSNHLQELRPHYMRRG